MSIFSKPVGQLITADIAELLEGKAVENIRLEFKREPPSKDETLKKLSSFANTYGGYLVIGAGADSKDGRLASLPGVEEKSGYKQTLVQWCFDAVFPPIEVDVSDPIPSPEIADRFCYVIFVGESENSPHFLNGRKGVWVRTNEFSGKVDPQLANEIEIRQLLNRRQVVLDRRASLLERARRRFDTFTNRKYREYMEIPQAGRSGAESVESSLSRLTNPQSIGCTLEFSVSPSFPSRALCDHSRLHDVVKGCGVPWRNGSFPLVRDSLITQHESVIALRPVTRFSILEANVWGLAFYATEIEDRVQDYQGIHLYNVLGDILVFMEHAGRILAGLGYAGPLRTDVRLSRLLGARWIYTADWTGTLMAGPSSETDDAVSFNLDCTTHDLASRRDGLAMEIMRLIFLATNSMHFADSPEKLEILRQKGYAYNFWPT